MHLFFYENKILSPEARWLLFQWSRVCGLDKPLLYPLAELGHHLGIPPQHVRTALKLLREQGFVERKNEPRGRGRPTSSHTLSLDFRKDLQQVSVLVTAHEPEIQSLCDHATTERALRKQSSESRMCGEQRANMLVPATYWLLGVLLAHAETPGSVRGLSYGRLVVLTGMTRERLKSQLAKLKSLGVISGHEPGVLKRKEGVSIRSVYALNLEHPLLLGEESVGLKLMVMSMGSHSGVNYLSGFYEAALVVSKFNENNESISKKIEEIGTPLSNSDEQDLEVLKEKSRLERRRYLNAYERLLQGARSLLPSSLELLEPISGYLLQLHRLGIGPALKAHIRSYAMMLLSNHWSDLEHGRSGAHKPVSAVRTAIQRDCVVDDRYSRKRESLPRSDFSDFIYALAHYIAVQLQHALKSVEWQQPDCDFLNALYSIESFDHPNYDCWLLKVHFRSSDGGIYLDDTIFILPSVSLSLPEGVESLVDVECE